MGLYGAARIRSTFFLMRPAQGLLTLAFTATTWLTGIIGFEGIVLFFHMTIDAGFAFWCWVSFWWCCVLVLVWSLSWITYRERGAHAKGFVPYLIAWTYFAVYADLVFVLVVNVRASDGHRWASVRSVSCLRQCWVHLNVMRTNSFIPL